MICINSCYGDASVDVDGVITSTEELMCCLSVCKQDSTKATEKNGIVGCGPKDETINIPMF